MALKLTEIEVAIAVAELPRKDVEGATVLVTQIEGELVFGRMSMDEFILEVADALEVTNRYAAAGGDFEMRVKPRALGLALRRLSAKERAVDLDTTLDDGSVDEAELQWVDRSHVRFVAPCGEILVFSRSDLEAVLETFG